MPDTTFFFYDLETTGTDPRRDRIMQFAGQRTDLDLNPIGEPVNLMVKLTDDVLPSPDAILITGITPQQVNRDGISEAELARILSTEVFTPGTIVAGFNNVRFDDTFIRFLFYRNFYDPYEWAYADGRSRWDLLDVVRLARALRPDGIQWPTDDTGKPVNKLALLSAANNLEHVKAHDALSDVIALIAVTKLLRDKQPKFYDYILDLRSKHEVAKLVNLHEPKPFVYASGRYPILQNHTTVAYPIAPGSKSGAVIVYDLRHNPEDYADMTAEQLADSRWAKAEIRSRPSYRPLPAKELAPNNCPAVAPLATLSPEAEKRIGLDRATAERHLAALRQSNLIAKLRAAMAPREFEPLTDVDARLYEGFISGPDKTQCAAIRTTTPTALANLKPHFNDPRLPEVFLRYKARNFPDALTPEEQTSWETYRTERLQTDLPAFAADLERVAVTATTPEAAGLLQDLQLWAQSILPGDI